MHDRCLGRLAVDTQASLLTEAKASQSSDWAVALRRSTEVEMKTTLSLAFCLLLLCAPVQARHDQEESKIEFGDVLVCDTQEQVERYVALYKGDQEAAVHAVNREENSPTACGIAAAVFVRGPQMATARAENQAFEIVRILVLGLYGKDGFRSVQPAPYFTAFGVTEYHV
jgi:hypothetical protein